MLPVAAGAAVALGSMASPASADILYTWIGGATGNWNPATTTNWLGGVGPVSGASTALNFSQGNGAAVTATNNIAGTFQAHSMSFAVNNAFTATTASGIGFQFVGPLPTINMNGLGSATLAAATGSGVQIDDNLTFGGSGAGNMTISAAISETSGSHSLTVPGGAPLRDMRMLLLGGANSFTGGLVLDGGTVGASGSNAAVFGAAGSTFTVTANGGTLAMASGVSSSLATLQLNGDLHVIGNNQLTLGTTSGTITNVALQGSAARTLYNELAGVAITVQGNSGSGAASPFAGAIVCRQSELPQMAGTNGGGLTLSGVAAQNTTPNGSINQATSIDMQAGGLLFMNNNILNSAQNGDRIGDTTPVRLRSANIQVNGPAAAGAAGYTPSNLTENIGDLSAAGNCNVNANNGTGAVTTTLNANSLIRLDRGTFVFRGTAIGDGVTANRGRITLTNPLAGSEFVGGGGAATSQNISILPYAVGGATSSDSGSSFVTYGADGFRLLTTAEYESDPVSLVPANATNNVRLTGSTTNNGTQTINSLLLASTGAVSGAVAGTGTLNITSGAILAAGLNGGTTISNNVNFGAAEGVISTAAFSSNGIPLTISGNLTGSNGLTKTNNNSSGSDNVLNLTGDNSGLTGQLTINAGKIQVKNSVAVPDPNTSLPGTGQIVVNGSNVSTSVNATGLYSAATSPWTLSRDVAVNTGTMTIRLQDQTVSPQTNLGNFTVAGTISGVGNVNYQAQVPSASVTTPGDIYVTNAANTYTGVTQFSAGNTHIAADGSTGNGGGWNFAGGVLVLEGSVANSRTINFSSTSTINTNGFDLTLSGPITGYGAGALSAAPNAGFNKTGLGRLTLTNTNNLVGGTVNVYNGTLLINGNLGPSATNNVFVGTIDGGAHYGTLGGSGTIYHNVIIATGGTLSPGGSAGSPGIMTIWGSLDMGSTINTLAATLSMDLNGPVAGTGYDQVVSVSQNAAAANTLKLGIAGTTTPANLALSLGYAPSASDVFWLINSTNTLGTANTTTGAFAGLPQGATVTLGIFGGDTYTGTISYSGNFDTGAFFGSGAGFNDVVIYNVVPAPGSIALLALGGMLAMRRKRRTA
jgi:hypothetical protein